MQPPVALETGPRPPPHGQRGPLAREFGARGSRARIGHADPTADPGKAAHAVLAGVPAWWETTALSWNLSGRWLDVGFAVDAAPPSVDTNGVLPADLTNLRGAEVGAAYASALDREVRVRHGRHYTPWALADRLWDRTRVALGHRQAPRALAGPVRDPACGGGILLIPPLREHLCALANVDPSAVLTEVPSVIEGIENDPLAAWIANVVLAAELLPLLAKVPAARRRPLPGLVRVGDGLARAGHPARAIVMNPPYARVRLAAVERARWERYLYGHANLYTLFMAAGIEALDERGALGAVIPTSFLAGRYFTALRDELAVRMPLRDLTFVELRDGVFNGVLQQTCLAVFGRRKARQASIATLNGSVTEVARVARPRGSRPWVLPRHVSDVQVALAAGSMPETLASTGWRVSTGPLVWNRRRRDLRGSRSSRCARIVWAADLDGGVLHQDGSRSHHRWIALRYPDEASLVLGEPAILVQRTTAPEQRRRVVCADLDAHALAAWGGRVVVENHVNVVRPAVEHPLISRETLAAVLSTHAIDRLTRCVSGSVALSAYELESLPLPDAETLACWETLRGDELEHFVAGAYQFGEA